MSALSSALSSAVVSLPSIFEKKQSLSKISRTSLGLFSCESAGLGFIPLFPIAGGDLVSRGGAVADLAEQSGSTVAQLSLAWLLRHSPVMLPIPGTGRVSHLEENVAAADVVLTDEQWAALDDLA